MTDDLPPKRDPDDDCNARRTDDGEFVGYCDLVSGWGRDADTGRCKYHNGSGGAREGSGAPEDNQNARDHGLYADPANVLEDLAETDRDGYEWILGKLDSYSSSAPFPVYEVDPADQDRGDPDELRATLTAKGDKLLQCCVREYCIWQATGRQIQEGMVVKTHKRGSDGQLVEVENENPVNLAVDRAERTVTKRLKELGILDDPDSQQASAEAGKVDALREMMDSLDSAEVDR